MKSEVSVQGVGLAPIDVTGLLDWIGARISRREPATVAYANVHVLNVAARDAELTAFLQHADLCYADGLGVVWAARLLGHVLPGRMTGADWIWDLAARAEREGWRIAWIGGEPGVTEAAARVLQARHPGVAVVCTEPGFIEDDAGVLARIAAARPDIVLVGMGTPTQERWVARHRAAIDAPVVWCLGATADFVSGKVSRGPAWLHRRQEWLARLVTEPGRLWRRFLVGNPVFFARVLRERFGGR